MRAPPQQAGKSGRQRTILIRQPPGNPSQA